MTAEAPNNESAPYAWVEHTWAQHYSLPIGTDEEVAQHLRAVLIMDGVRPKITDFIIEVARSSALASIETSQNEGGTNNG